MKKLYINNVKRAAVACTGAIASLALLFSCTSSDFDLYPKDSMQMITYMNNTSEVDKVLTDAYYYLTTISQNIIYINSLATDEAYDDKINNATDYILLNECNWDATLDVTSSVWNDCFSMINRCNSVLDKMDKVSDTKKAQYEGEAKFFRAYAYFNLVRLFGPVPISKTVINNYSDLYGYDRNSTDEVYALIKSDLADAIKDLPDNYSDASSKGRATKIAAYTMQAEMLMTLKDFAGAKTALDYVINYANTNPTLLGLESEVRSIYDSQNPIGKEIILAAQYNNGSTPYTNELMRRCMDAARPQSQSSYVDENGNASTITVSQAYSCAVMTWELYNQLRKNGNDKRFTKLVYDGVSNNTSVCSASDEVLVDAKGNARIPMTLKYYDFDNMNAKLTKCMSGCDNIIYRYADVLLMYAECLNETGNTTSAATYLNIVRTRAGIDGTTASTKSEMALAIENERLLELNFEGHRWFDLLRTGRLTAVMEAHFAHRTPGLSAVYQANDNGMIVKDNTSTTATSTAKWKWTNSSNPILFPIPYDQLQLMPNWSQNAGY